MFQTKVTLQNLVPAFYVLANGYNDVVRATLPPEERTIVVYLTLYQRRKGNRKREKVCDCLEMHSFYCPVSMVLL